MVLGKMFRKFLKSSIGQKITCSCLSAAEEYRGKQNVYFYEKLYREEFFTKAMRFLSFNKVKGDYLEFGCFGGITFELAHKYRHLHELNMRLYAFDSFRGLPKPKGIDIHDQWREGDFSINMQDFIEKLEIGGIKENEYVLVPGFYEDSLKENPPEKIGVKKAAFVYIDCDLYESTMPVLNYVLPILQTGTIVAFDDFYCFNGDPERGGQLAFNEFLMQNSNVKMIDYLNFGWHGKSFISKINEPKIDYVSSQVYVSQNEAYLSY
jgi:hypothetical protein